MKQAIEPELVDHLCRGKFEGKICLKCDQKFPSKGNHNRLCWGCRSENMHLMYSGGKSNGNKRVTSYRKVD